MPIRIVLLLVSLGASPAAAQTTAAIETVGGYAGFIDESFIHHAVLARAAASICHRASASDRKASSCGAPGVGVMLR